jgi:MFS family permease
MSKNPVLNPFAESVGTPAAFMGFVAAASTLPGILISFPAGFLSDLFGRRRVLIASTIIFASAPILYVFVNAWWQLVLVRFYHGFATAIFVPVARATIADHYPSQRGERISAFTSATIVGRGIAPFLGGFILSVSLWNFQLLYVAVGLVGCTTFLITLFFFQTRVDVVSEPSRPVETHSTQDKSHEELAKGWREIMKDPEIVVVSSTEAAARYVYGALEFFLVGYLKNVVQLDPSLIGVIMGGQFILIPLVSPLMGRMSDRIGRIVPILMGLLLSGLSIVVVPYVTGFLPLLAISLTYGLGFSTVISSTPALIADLVSPEAHGAAMGFLATIMDVGQMLGPIVTGAILASFGYAGSFLSLGAILLIIGILFSGYRKVKTEG